MGRNGSLSFIFPTAKPFEEAFRKWCDEEGGASGKKKKVEKPLFEVVEVRHELWSDEEEEEEDQHAGRNGNSYEHDNDDEDDNDAEVEVEDEEEEEEAQNIFCL